MSCSIFVMLVVFFAVLGRTIISGVNNERRPFIFFFSRFVGNCCVLHTTRVTTGYYLPRFFFGSCAFFLNGFLVSNVLMTAGIRREGRLLRERAAALSHQGAIRIRLHHTISTISSTICCEHVHTIDKHLHVHAERRMSNGRCLATDTFASFVFRILCFITISMHFAKRRYAP